MGRYGLIYSPSLGCVYCFVRILFSKEETNFVKDLPTGNMLQPRQDIKKKC